MQQENKVIHIAIFCSQGLGDCLLQMSIANNLAKQGYKVSFYSDFAWQLRNLVDNYLTEQLPDTNTLHAIFEKVDIVLYDSRAPYILSMTGVSKDLFVKRAIAYRISSGDAPKTLFSEQDLFEGKQSEHAQRFLKFNNSLRIPNHFWQTRLPVIKQITQYLDNIVGLDNVTMETGLTLLGCKADPNKVLIHPSSSNRKKNWYPENFIKLAHKLKQDGLNPVFTVAPHEREFWLPKVGNDFDLPIFENIQQLAEFYSDASWFIGTDSGNAHLASCLGVPTFQIFNRWRKQPRWRAGWAPGKIVIAKFPYNLSKYKWSEGLSVETAYQQFQHWKRNL